MIDGEGAQGRTELDRWGSEYHEAVHAAARAGIEADPEAQLTTPVDVLVTRIAAHLVVGAVHGRSERVDHGRLY